MGDSTKYGNWADNVTNPQKLWEKRVPPGKPETLDAVQRMFSYTGPPPKTQDPLGAARKFLGGGEFTPARNSQIPLDTWRDVKHSFTNLFTVTAGGLNTNNVNFLPPGAIPKAGVSQSPAAKFNENFQPVSSFIGTTLGTMPNQLASNLSAGGISSSVGTALERISPRFKQDTMASHQSLKLDELSHLPSQLIGSVRNVASASNPLLSGPSSLVKDVYGGAMGVTHKMNSALSGVMNMGQAFAMKAVGFNAGFLTKALGPIMTGIQGALGGLSGNLSSITNAFGGNSVLSSFSANITGKLSSGMLGGSLKGVDFGNLAGKLGGMGGLGNITGKLGGGLNGIVGGAASKIGGAFGGISGGLGGASGMLGGMAGGPGGILSQAGGMFGGLKGSIQAGPGGAVDALTGRLTGSIGGAAGGVSGMVGKLGGSVSGMTGNLGGMVGKIGGGLGGVNLQGAISKFGGMPTNFNIAGSLERIAGGASTLGVDTKSPLSIGSIFSDPRIGSIRGFVSNNPMGALSKLIPSSIGGGLSKVLGQKSNFGMGGNQGFNLAGVMGNVKTGAIGDIIGKFGPQLGMLNHVFGGQDPVPSNHITGPAMTQGFDGTKYSLDHSKNVVKQDPPRLNIPLLH